MNLRDIDMNLLVIFHQLLLERSVSAAADKLDLTQPAVSNALKRLSTGRGRDGSYLPSLPRPPAQRPDGVEKLPELHRVALRDRLWVRHLELRGGRKLDRDTPHETGHPVVPQWMLDQDLEEGDWGECKACWLTAVMWGGLSRRA